MSQNKFQVEFNRLCHYKEYIYVHILFNCLKLFMKKKFMQGKGCKKGTDISRKENFKCVYHFLFIITKLILKSESLLLFKLNQLILPIGKKPAPGDHKYSLKFFICKLSFARCP